jgi:hypothetical protein
LISLSAKKLSTRFMHFSHYAHTREHEKDQDGKFVSFACLIAALGVRSQPLRLRTHVCEGRGAVEVVVSHERVRFGVAAD